MLHLCYKRANSPGRFRDETLAYVRNLQAAGVDARADVFHGNVHAFDILNPWTREAREAKRRLCEQYERVIMENRLEKVCSKRDRA